MVHFRPTLRGQLQQYDRKTLLTLTHLASGHPPVLSEPSPLPILEDALHQAAQESKATAARVLLQVHMHEAVAAIADVSLRSALGAAVLASESPLDIGVHDVGGWTRTMRIASQLYRLGRDQPTMSAIGFARLESLRLCVSRLARKQGNLGLADRLLSAATGSTIYHAYESAKLDYVRGRVAPAIKKLATVCFIPDSLGDLWKSAELTSMTTKGPIAGRALTRLATWIQSDEATTAAGVGVEITAVQRHVRDALTSLGLAQPSSPLWMEPVGRLVVDHLVGQCLRLATYRAAGYAKAHLAHASWCYRQGRRRVGKGVDKDGRALLSDADVERIRAAITPRFAAQPQSLDAALDAVVNVFRDTQLSDDILVEDTMGKGEEVQVGDETAASLRTLDSSDPRHRLALVRRMLARVLQTGSDSVMSPLLSVWSEIRTQLLNSYELAARSYFVYLTVGSQDARRASVPTSSTTRPGLPIASESSDTDVTEAQRPLTDDDVVTATLRLLRLLVKHGTELQHVLSPGFATTPTHPWQAVVPQLFARLSHPSAYIRHQVQVLLRRIGRDYPHVLVYPAVVGANTTSADEASVTEAAEGETDQLTLSVVRPMFTAMVASLREHAPALVDQVQTLIGELKRIAVLWEEMWLDALARRQNEVARRIQRLVEEAARVRDNLTLSDTEKRRVILDKHMAIMKPVVVALERLHSQTIAKEPETPHEQAFRKEFSGPIAAALEELRHPTADVYSPEAAWAPMKLFHESLRRYYARRTSRTLHLRSLSPSLHRVHAAAVSMPGVPMRDPRSLVTVEAIDEGVTILQTKTRPKKISILGSDGARYSYLIKGSEDLHLDERIMQFLDIVNVMFRCSSRQQELRARHYSVIPLDTTAGLIQWVDGAVPVYTLYRKWRQRMTTQQRLPPPGVPVAHSGHAHQPSHASRGRPPGISTTASSGAARPAQGTQQPQAQPSGVRPTDLYYALLTPALKERGLTRVDVRSKWPCDVLHSVVAQLTADTPSDLISR